MSYKNLTKLCKTIAGSLRGSNVFIVARDQALNVKDPKADVIVITNITSITDVNETSLTKTYQITLRFLRRDELSASEESKNNLIAAMEDLQNEFIQKVNQDDLVALLANVNTGFVYNQYDANMSGVQLNMNVQLFDNANYC